MYEKFSASKVCDPVPPSNYDPQKINLFGEMTYGAGSDLIRTELGAYQEKLFGSGSAYVPRNVNTNMNILYHISLSSCKLDYFYQN